MERAQLPERVEIDSGGDVLLAAEDAARLLGAPLGAFLTDLRAGHVFSIVERGESGDAGRIRATLRWRGAEVRLVVEAGTGWVIEVSGSA